jgi:hypothetical protein
MTDEELAAIYLYLQYLSKLKPTWLAQRILA